MCQYPSLPWNPGQAENSGGDGGTQTLVNLNYGHHLNTFI